VLEIKELEKQQQEIPRLEGMPPYKKIIIKDAILDQNIKLYEEAKQKGVIPGEELVTEEPQAQEYFDWVRKVEKKTW